MAKFICCKVEVYVSYGHEAVFAYFQGVPTDGEVDAVRDGIHNRTIKVPHDCLSLDKDQYYKWEEESDEISVLANVSRVVIGGLA